jgi:NAD(P)-dependent dehydrogenase (short-subunit alcohol dehydrogenase family)
VTAGNELAGSGGQLLKGKVAVITGAGSGVGRATALRFAANGARVVCGDLRKEWTDQTVELVQAAGGQALSAECDVTEEAQVEELVALAVRTYGRLDVIHNNAGVSTVGMSIEDHTDSQWEWLMNINLRGVFYGAKHAVIAFKRQGDGGAIINTSSIAGLVGVGGVGYGASKGGVTHFTRTLAIEVAPFMIRVNAICPGPMVTNFTRSEEQKFSEATEQELGQFRAGNPLPITVMPDHVADAALFLASDLSAAITGVALPVDCGYTAR